MTRYARRTDNNHAEIRDALRKIGLCVADTSWIGRGHPDLTVFTRGHVTFIEIKNSAKPPSARALTPQQRQFHNAALMGGVRIHVVETVEQALAIFGARVQLTGPEAFAEKAA